ncbi:MAG: hypothetical protein WA047_20455 [Phenylobacterium sp.]|uniref:hypothetical protein n=1 Tax=Phenylobacterium sp. TaxID=1871053 RepID=UPI003BB6620F
MTDIVVKCEDPLAVQTHDGWVVLFGNLEDGQVGLFFSPGAADETGRRLRETARREAGAPMPDGHVAKIDFAPPTSIHEMADVRLTLTSGETVNLTIALPDLATLADTARAALEAVVPSGQA